jgi:hypothetical protein
MKRKLFLAGMILIVLVFGFTLMSCGEKEVKNPFVGSWTGTVEDESAEEPDVFVDAYITFTDTTWEYVVDTPPPASHGSYTFSGNEAALNSTSGQIAIKIFDAVINNNTLILTIVGGDPNTFIKQD